MTDFDMPLLFDLVLRTFVVMTTLVVASRLFGLRSFAQMSGFDFPVVLATGAVLASTVTNPQQPVWIPALAIVALFVWQMVLAPLRQRFALVAGAVDNRPRLVMKDGQVLDDNLRKGGMTRSDLWAKLREANVAKLDQVRIAVVESTGEVTVIHGADEVSPELLEDVRG